MDKRHIVARCEAGRLKASNFALKIGSIAEISFDVATANVNIDVHSVQIALPTLNSIENELIISVYRIVAPFFFFDDKLNATRARDSRVMKGTVQRSSK